jgi:hypothetical protein
MRNKKAIVLISIFPCVMVGMARAEQDRFKLKAPNGVAFAEFRGYENWQTVAVSQTNDGIKAILANPMMIKAYREGIPDNGKPFPEGSAVVKIEWSKKINPKAQYFVEVPEALKSVSFIKKDSKRFQDTDGWGYAQFLYDAASKSFKPYGSDASFGKTVCHKCHIAVSERDYIFTNYPPR